MSWEKAPSGLTSLLERVLDDQLAAQPGRIPARIVRRRLGGGLCAFARGHLFAGVVDDGLMLRLPTDARRRFLRMEGGRPIAPPEVDGGAEGEYVRAPAHLLANPGGLRRWLDLSLEHALRLPPRENGHAESPAREDEPTARATPPGAPRRRAARKKATRKKATRKKATRKKAARKKATRKKATRKKATRKKATRKKATRKKAARKKAARKKAARKKATRKKATRKKATRKKAARKKRTR